MDAVPCPDGLRRRLTKYIPQPSPMTNLSRETELKPTEFRTDFPREDGKNILGDKHRYFDVGDTRWDFTMGERKARLDMRVDWRLMKHHVEEEAAGLGSAEGGTSASSVYVWQDAGFQVMTGLHHSSAVDIIQVYTEEPGRFGSIGNPVSFLEDGMPAVEGRNGLNVQGKMSLTDPRNPL
jgi:hypothetical protein